MPNDNPKTTPAQQAKPQPLSDEQIRNLFKDEWAFETVKQWVRIVEAAQESRRNNP